MSTASVVIPLILPVLTLAASCTNSTGAVAPSWFVENYGNIVQRLLKDENLMRLPWVGLGKPLKGISELGAKERTADCKGYEKCYSAAKEPFCLDDEAKTVWAGPVLVYSDTLDYVLPDCSKGNLATNDASIKKYAKELGDLMKSSNTNKPAPTACATAGRASSTTSVAGGASTTVAMSAGSNAAVSRKLGPGITGVVAVTAGVILWSLGA